MSSLRMPPCPKCSGQPGVHDYSYSGRQQFYAQCGVCGFKTPDAVGKAANTSNEAKQRWFALIKDYAKNPKKYAKK